MSQTPALSEQQKEAKLRTLMAAEGFATLDDLLAEVVGDSINPAICINPDCSYTCEMEPDQERGYCDECHTNTMQSALILAGII
jgi:hypothetical protein